MPTIQVDELYANKVMKYLKELEYTKYPDNDLNSNCSCDSCAKDLYDTDKKDDKKSSKSVSRGQSHQAYKDAEYTYNTIGCCSEKSYAKYGKNKKFSKSTSGKNKSHQAYKGADYAYKTNDCCSVKSCAVGKGGARSTSGKSHKSGRGPCKDGEHEYNEIDCCSEKAYSTKSGKTNKTSKSKGAYCPSVKGRGYSTSGKSNKGNSTSGKSHQGYSTSGKSNQGYSTSGKANQAYGDAEYAYNEPDFCSEKGPPSYTPGIKGESYYTASNDKINGDLSRSRAGSTRSIKSDKSDNWQPIIKLMPDDIERITKKKRWCRNPWLLVIIILLALLLAAAIITLIVLLATGKFGKKEDEGDTTGTAAGRLAEDGTCDCSQVDNIPVVGQVGGGGRSVLNSFSEQNTT